MSAEYASKSSNWRSSGPESHASGPKNARYDSQHPKHALGDPGLSRRADGSPLRVHIGGRPRASGVNGHNPASRRPRTATSLSITVGGTPLLTLG